MVLDRLFLWIFTLAVCVGTAGIILQAPSLYDERKPIDREISGKYHINVIDMRPSRWIVTLRERYDTFKKIVQRCDASHDIFKGDTEISYKETP